MSDANEKPKVKSGPTRRAFLASVGVGAVAAGGVGAVPLSRGRTALEEYPDVPENRVELPPNGKSVVIMGGGLSGLQAGVELSARGFEVTVLERSGTPGGKLKSWRDKTFGPDDDPLKKDPNFKGYIREHGVHGVWGFYNNLREFMGRYGWPLDITPDQHAPYLFIDKDGGRQNIEYPNWPPPYNRIQQLLFSKHPHFGSDSEGFKIFQSFMTKLAVFDYADPAQREYLDSMTFREYAEACKVPAPFIDRLFQSLCEMAYFNTIEKSSALTVTMILRLAAGAPEDVKIDLYSCPPGETFLEPMAEYIRSRGGKVIYNTEVNGLRVENGKLREAIAHAIPGPRYRRCAICGNLYIDGVELDACPFCGAEAGQLVLLTEEESSERGFTADYFINAMDVLGSQRLVKTNLEALGDAPYFRDIAKLQATGVFVLYLWYEGQEFWKNEIRHNENEYGVYFFGSGFKILSLACNWGLPMSEKPDEKRWRHAELADRDISLIEVQIARTEEVSGMSPQQIADGVHEDLKSVMGEIPPYRSYSLNRWHHYTDYPVGGEKMRPPVQSPIDNLLFIGDLAFVPHLAVFMEKTNVTAKWATNLLLDKIGQSEGKIKILECGTPSVLLAILKRLQTIEA